MRLEGVDVARHAIGWKPHFQGVRVEKRPVDGLACGFDEL
jgi:hypothetical protein